jgi:hypothetical protein
MDGYFLVSDTGHIALIPHFYSAGFLLPFADNQTSAVRELVTALTLRRGRDRPKGSPAIELTSFAQWTQKGGFWKLLNK